MNKELIKKIAVYTGIILLFAVLAYGFTPQVLGGKIVNQSDIASWKGMANEAVTHNAAHPDDPTAWTNSMFSGMPTATTIDDFKGDWTRYIYDFLLTGRRPASYFLIALLGGFLLMLSLGTGKAVAVGGAIAVAFCSYNMQIIQVGHNTKMQAIAYFPWVMAAIIFTYKSALAEGKTWKSWLPKTLLGATLFALALSMQIKANHIQITYYLAVVIFVYAAGLLISLCINKDKRRQLTRFFAASAFLAVIGCIGIATNANKLVPIYEYTPYTMRGGSELSSGSNSKGLDLGYATAWSYGIEETPNLLIPNFNGGSSSGAMDPDDSEVYALLKRAGQPNLRQVMKSLPLYWGPQPFTAGPMYLGAISIFLFVLGLILCKGREKWWILAATVIAVMLAWGSHFMWFTKLWFSYAPMYNKFRTVSMALTVLQMTVPMLGFLVLDKITKETYTKKEFLRAGGIAWAFTAGFCLLCMVFPGIAGTFTGVVDAGQPEVLVDALAADRQTLLFKDALRSFMLITVAFALICWGYRAREPFAAKGRMYIVPVVICILVWLDMTSVGKRYLNKDHFVTPRDFSAAYAPRPVDNIIHEDTDPDYRVLDISVNTFNDAIQCYHHKCIGGYNPVKMQRYQDLIDRYLSREIQEIYAVAGKAATIQEVEDGLPELKALSMLNGKYIILGADLPPVRNPHAFGHCWFVSDAVAAHTPDEEIAMLAETDLRTAAVVGDDFAWARDAIAGASALGVSASGFSASDQESVTDSELNPGAEPVTDFVAPRISMISYAPNELCYEFVTGSPSAVVFSEIYYPDGWKAWVEPAGTFGKVKDGIYVPTDEAVPAEIFRADWILRGVVLPAGEGRLIMRFEPDSYRIGENVSRASSIVLLLLLLLASGWLAALMRKNQ